jgi:DNA-directed RNA polymerase specialized sigma24 family protein
VAGPDATTLDAVRRLSPPLRDVVLLHYYADLPIDEVARVLRRPVGTVKRRLFDARVALAAALEESR